MHHLVTAPFGQARIYPLHSEKSGEGEAVAVLFGSPEAEEFPLLRLHSRCLYGELLRSPDCDCLAQYELATQMMVEEGSGILVYLEQEGRGCGLVRKAQAYELMERQGLDTVEAYEALGLPLDARSYGHVADFLISLGLRGVRLLTNNPRKIDQLDACGLEVMRVPLQTGASSWNIEYLATKQTKLGHDLGLRLHNEEN